MTPSLRVTAAVLAVLLSSSGASSTSPAIAAESRTLAKPPTPALIERAIDRGELRRRAADRLLIEALRGEPVPDRYASDTPFRGTLVLLQLHDRLERLPSGPRRRSMRAMLHPIPIGTDQCDLSNAPLPDTIESAHFYIEYNALLLGGGLTINDYIGALETSWSKEVDEFGWAAPPSYTPNPAPNNKYPVRIDTLGPMLYGFVSDFGTHAGRVGNNPATAWNEGSAEASCLVLNTNFDPFPGEPMAALHATAAHEFNHSIQFGWGVLSSTNRPDEVFVEGGATWIEDEVFDDANDNYNYLWPVFEDDMGQYEGTPTRSPYDYWITWRGLSEPFGTGVAGGGEDVLQLFWELVSKRQSGGLDALGRALESKGSSLGAAYHAYAIAVKFNRSCGGGYQLPYCLEEGPAYVAVKGPTATHGSVAMNQSLQGRLPDNYSLNWIALPQNTQFQVSLKNTSDGGRFRASVACDAGTGFVIRPFTALVNAGETAFVRSYDPAECPAPIAVITNITQTQANPGSSSSRTYALSVAPPATASRLSLRGRVSGSNVVATGSLKPRGRGRVRVTLLERARRWEKVKSRQVTIRGAGRFRTRFHLPDARRCRLEAMFAGDAARLPSATSRSFLC
jgi:hypothetical protein